MNRINYVIASWSGHRSQRESPEMGRRFLRAHINKVMSLKHNLSQITICNPDNPSHEEYRLHSDLINELMAQHPSLIKVLNRSNAMVAYGSWSDAYGKYRTEFDYYILMEDDYVPVQDNFDQILIDLIGKNPKVGYLGALLSNTSCVPDGRKHMGVTNGIAITSALEAVYQKFGSLMASYVEPEYWLNQVNFSLAFMDCGYELADWSREYNVPFWYAQSKSTLDFVSDKGKSLIVPLETIGGY